MGVIIGIAPPGQEGWTRHQENVAKHPEYGADGVVVLDRRILPIEPEPPPRLRLRRSHPSWPGGAIALSMTIPAYTELHAASAFSFLDGASLPEELARTGAELGMPAMALLDRDGVYGGPQFHKAAEKAGIHPHIGVELTSTDGSCYPLLAESRRGYQNICRLTTRMKMRA